MEFVSADERALTAKKSFQDFSKLLDDITTLEEKKKVLWKQIYENAVEDRMHAYMMMVDLYVATQGKPEIHQLNGPTFAKYIERMSRANDQLLKLAELVQNAQEQDAVVMSDDEIFDKIKQGK